MNWFSSLFRTRDTTSTSSLNDTGHRYIDPEAVALLSAKRQALAEAAQPDQGHGEYQSATFMSRHEVMCFRTLQYLCRAHNLTPFAQVSMKALLRVEGEGRTALALRGKIAQQVVDFVVTDQNFKPLAVIELDDASHSGKQEQDALRDARLREAGYAVYRIPNLRALDRAALDQFLANLKK